jgi:hypothetical protein
VKTLARVDRSCLEDEPSGVGGGEEAEVGAENDVARRWGFERLGAALWRRPRLERQDAEGVGGGGDDGVGLGVSEEGGGEAFGGTRVEDGVAVGREVARGEEVEGPDALEREPLSGRIALGGGLVTEEASDDGLGDFDGDQSTAGLWGTKQNINFKKYTHTQNKTKHNTQIKTHNTHTQQNTHKTKHRTHTNKTKQNKTKQNKTKQNKTKQNKTKQNKTKQNKTKQNKTKQNTKQK